MTHDEAVMRAIRAELALKAILSFSANASFGGWRQIVADFANIGLGR